MKGVPPQLLSLLLSLLPDPQAASRPELSRFYEMLRDYPLRGGKGLRSELLLRSAAAHGAPEGQESALWLALGLELFQNWALVHDDIVDDSEERRGHPTLHRLHGEHLAINVGDALHAYMWAAVANSGLRAATSEFLTMTHRTAEGQHLDIEWVKNGVWGLKKSDYLQMVELKTAHYTIVHPLRLGALAAGAAPSELFTEAGKRLGASFQIFDDVLNLVGNADSYGKEIGGDLLEGKRTLIALLWLEGANSAQKDDFLRFMAQPRAQKSESEMLHILQWIKESGSIEAAANEARTLASEGEALLAEALQHAANKDAAAELLHWLAALPSRQR